MKMKKEYKRLEQRTETPEESNRLERTSFNIFSIAALIAGAAAIYAGATERDAMLEGFGYGIVGMDALINTAIRGFRYIMRRPL